MSEATKSPWYVRSAVWLADYWVDLGLAAVSLGLVVAGVLISDEAAERLFPGDQQARRDYLQFSALCSIPALALANIGLFVLHVKRGNRVSGLTRRIRDLETDLADARSDHESEKATWVTDAQTLSLGHLVNIGIKLGFGTKGRDSERVTLYAPLADNMFRPVARFSFDPEFQKLSRKLYQPNQGCIAKAWRNGCHWTGNYPDPGSDLGAYLGRCERDGIPRETASAFNMKSRFYFGWRIRDKRDVRSLAVVIVESTLPKRYAGEELKKEFDESIGRFLSDLLEFLEPQLPNVVTLRERDM